MPKRKLSSAESAPAPPPSLASLDAALDLLACETFTRLQALTSKFEVAAGVRLNDGVVKHRWDEAVKRYWVMKSMDDLSCGGVRNLKTALENECSPPGEVHADDSHYERPLPKSHHPGAVIAFGLDSDEEIQWRRWSPRAGDMVLIELQDRTTWPGKIIDKRVFFQGRTIPRGNHFYAVRIYSDMEPTVTVKSRLVPLSLRPTPPLLASTSVLSAYNHAANPTQFDMLASSRESAAAHARSHPGVSDDEDAMAKVRASKDAWKKFVNWLMDERRVEKLRSLCEERDRRLKAVARSEARDLCAGECNGEEPEALEGSKKRRVTVTASPQLYAPTASTVFKLETDEPDRGGIFQIAAIPSLSSSTSACSQSNNIRSPAPMASYIRPALATPYRSSSPRRADRRRGSGFPGLGEFSPRARGGTYTPPRVLPSGDETAPYASPSPAPPSLKNFDFVSPLGTSKFVKSILDSDQDTVMLSRNGAKGTSLEAVEEEVEEEGWTVVAKGRTKRAGSAPPVKTKEPQPRPVGVSSDDMVL
ncbi:hypothetical protein VHUM_02471 [Vanrija humicola]|uniref:Uncharacterized protein n=1 Tax=Vanrija humicola TaxID=5417 RepID=A0A7D8V0N8_VANHU|nr:hypothetical protein VHUM_02471 [Vanrija humicola]